MKKIAIVHEWFATYGGSEKVVEQILGLYPHADLFAVIDFLPDRDRVRLLGKRATTTFIQRLPKARTHFRNYLALMPIAIEQLDLSKYDIVISSNHAVAKGVITGPGQLHISYVHTPIRYAWDLQHQYLSESGLAAGLKGGIARLALHYMRQWDVRAANGVDVFIANSKFIARRIEKTYRRESTVIYPPVEVAQFEVKTQKDNFFLTASRLVPYKKIPLIVQAFSQMPEKRLVVIGDGPELARVKSLAGPNVAVLGYQSHEDLVKYMQSAKAFVFAAEEDFGIAPVEAQACGTPVIAFGRGGALETVLAFGEQSTRTGLFFGEQSVGSIVNAVNAFEALPNQSFSAVACRANAERFAPMAFRDALSSCVEHSWQSFCSQAES